MSDGGIYGDMLGVFPELLNDFTIFNMQAAAGGGYGPRTNIRTVTGIYRAVPGGKMGIMAENREPNQIGTLWLYEDDADRVEEGTFLTLGSDSYILTKSNGYLREGGFVEFMVGLVAGPTDAQTPNVLPVEQAKYDFQ